MALDRRSQLMASDLFRDTAAPSSADFLQDEFGTDEEAMDDTDGLQQGIEDMEAASAAHDDEDLVARLFPLQANALAHGTVQGELASGRSDPRPRGKPAPKQTPAATTEEPRPPSQQPSASRCGPPREAGEMRPAAGECG
jgi:hypothetical protein